MNEAVWNLAAQTVERRGDAPTIYGLSVIVAMVTTCVYNNWHVWD